MAKLRPYIAIDIETTGLNIEKSHILQIGWVIDDGVSPRDQLERGSVIIKENSIKYGEPFALAMNQWLFQEMSKKEPKYPMTYPSKGISILRDAIQKTSILANKFDEEQGRKRPSPRVQIAGKNASSFDWPIIVNTWKKSEFQSRNEISEREKWLRTFIDHRFLDCGSIFFHHFGYNPGFDEINKLIGWKDINHDALDDAMNVVVALRYDAGMNF